MTRPRKEPPPPGEPPEAHEEAQAAPPAPAAAPPDGRAAPGTRPDEALAAKALECRELVAQVQRLAADYSNYQKRTQRIIDDEKWRAVGDVVLDLLPAIDNFERALAAAREKPDFQSFIEGVRLVHAQLLAGLKQHGIVQIEAGGRPFNPEHHEAVAHLASEEHAEGRVIHEMHKGYLFDGRILRPSRVTVSKGKPGEQEGGPEPRREASGEGDGQED